MDNCEVVLEQDEKTRSANRKEMCRKQPRGHWKAEQRGRNTRWQKNFLLQGKIQSTPMKEALNLGIIQRLWRSKVIKMEKSLTTTYMSELASYINYTFYKFFINFINQPVENPFAYSQKKMATEFKGVGHTRFWVRCINNIFTILGAEGIGTIL